MTKLEGLKPEKVFKYFEEISAIPRGSGNMKAIADYCEKFAERLSLKCVRDGANNVVIYKPGTPGYESAQPVILQGHLDIVCQKDSDREIDFEKDGLDIFVDGDYIKARGTTLGADNGIAVAMVMAILDSDEIPHPPIEALFTTDEEVGMIGASQLDGTLFKGKKLINLDSEEQDKLTVSCAGGSEFELNIPVSRKKVSGSKITISISGLKGGHSGIEIDKGRINAAMLAGRILNELTDFDIISITGGDKSNAITNACKIELVSAKPEKLMAEMENCVGIIEKEISDIEPGFDLSVTGGDVGEYNVIDSAAKDKLIFTLLFMPNGVQSMSASIEGLVETSLNMGILKTEEDRIVAVSALRSNKQTALENLEKKLKTFAKALEIKVKTYGHYPPWEYKENSKLQEIYKKCFKEKFGYQPTVEAIHAGLECGTLSAKIQGLDAISVGPELSDVHTTGEKLKISSAKEMFELVCELLEKMK